MPARADIVKIAFEINAGTPDAFTETLWAERVGSEEFRIGNTPFYAAGVSYQDVVRAFPSGGQLRFDRVTKRGGHSTYRASRIGSREHFAEHWMRLRALGCQYESFDNLFAIDVPTGADIGAVQSMLQ